MMILSRTKAFTLLELVIVIIIIGVLSSLALPRLMSMIERSRATEAYVAISSIRNALERYYLMNGSFDGISMDALGIEDPGLSPNAHFTYSVAPFAMKIGPPMRYEIWARRNTRDIADLNAYYDDTPLPIGADMPCPPQFFDGYVPTICAFGGYGGVYEMQKSPPYK